MQISMATFPRHVSIARKQKRYGFFLVNAQARQSSLPVHYMRIFFCLPPPGMKPIYVKPSRFAFELQTFRSFLLMNLRAPAFLMRLIRGRPETKDVKETTKRSALTRFPLFFHYIQENYISDETVTSYNLKSVKSVKTLNT